MRLFIAVPVPEAHAAAGALISELRSGGADVKWVSAADVHLTLSFQGEVPADKVAILKGALAAAAAGFPSFSAELSGVGAFPSLKDPSVIWIGVAGGSDQLAALAVRMREELASRGLLRETEGERPFFAHLTIGRRRGLKDRHRLRKQLLAARFGSSVRVDRLALYQSRLSAEGPVYSILAEVPLKG